MARHDQPKSPTTKKETGRQTHRSISHRQKERSISLYLETPLNLEDTSNVQRIAPYPIYATRIPKPRATATAAARTSRQRRTV